MHAPVTLRDQVCVCLGMHVSDGDAHTQTRRVSPKSMQDDLMAGPLTIVHMDDV